MLSYQHAYHAGNHADILKHYVLNFVLKSMNKKDKPYTFFDTHSGSGLYDLLDNRSLKTGEAESGIKHLLQELKEKGGDGLKTLPDSFADYISFVEPYTKKNTYPGSPEIERKLLRPCDSLVLSELHPQEIENLKKNMQDSLPKLQVHKQNGFELLNALTPPSTKRGAVLIDPSYEEKADFEQVFKTVAQVHKKWSGGIFMIWYPLLDRREIELNTMLEALERNVRSVNANTEILKLELCVRDKNPLQKENAAHLYGSGMFIINPPWKLAEEGSLVAEKLSAFFRSMPS